MKQDAASWGEPPIDVEVSGEGFLVTARRGTLQLDPDEFAGLLYLVAGVLDAEAGVGPGVIGPGFVSADRAAGRYGLGGNRADRRAARSRRRV